MKKIIIRTDKSLHCYECIGFYIDAYVRSITVLMQDEWVTFKDVKYYIIKE